MGYGYQLDVKSMGGLSFAKRVTDMRMLSKTSSIFVQTDKAAYKPGDLGIYCIIIFIVLSLVSAKSSIISRQAQIILSRGKRNYFPKN